jgi:hypothetical protein
MTWRSTLPRRFASSPQHYVGRFAKCTSMRLRRRFDEMVTLAFVSLCI